MLNVLGVDFKHTHTAYPTIMEGHTAPSLLSVNQSSIINKVFQLSIREHFSLMRIVEQVDTAAFFYTGQCHVTVRGSRS